MKEKGYMMDMAPDEKRSDVRADFSFKVKFNIMTLEEYENLKKSDEVIPFTFKQEPSIGVADTGIGSDITINAALVNYLIKMDEKLDEILSLLSKDKTKEKPSHEGKGVNISGSGMQIISDKPVESGRIIQSKFYLSKFPLVFMDIIGQATRITHVDEADKTLYQIGIKFLDLSENDREKIISSVFQKQREAIRGRKNKL